MDQLEIAQAVERLLGMDSQTAYEALLCLEEESARSDAVCAYWDRFAALLNAPNAYSRVRGLRLIAANARWDTAGRLEALLPAFLLHLNDVKPVVVRQCVQLLPGLAAAKPALEETIRSALQNMDLSGYRDSMRPLIERDAAQALECITHSSGAAALRITYRDTRAFTEAALASLFQSVGWYSGAFPALLCAAFAQSSRVLSAWDGERLVGLIRGMDDGGWQATIDCLLVDPVYQGRGIAGELLERLKAVYADFLYINVMPEDAQNVPFYEKHGFSVLREGAAMQRMNRVRR